ncbi:hypothetical protein L6164_020795 [Bauhinia variegata]|uniref:Uncharacterized protein n=1 Tax=Bauhinia variegata TaxID=167791 RepID=A0ACB9MX04_BAUVA|nr:hypothetical protein L6164_020795 [Bauhinia variegata]
MLYEMTLEQKWEQIFSCENVGMEGNRVMVNAGVQKQLVLAADREAVHKESDIAGGKEKQVRVERVEELEGNAAWKKFECYVLVGSFSLRRLDGSLVLTYSFKHTRRIKTNGNEDFCFSYEGSSVVESS